MQPMKQEAKPAQDTQSLPRRGRAAEAGQRPPESPGGDCPATRTIQVIGGRWKLSLLYFLLGGVQRYSDLQRCLPAITPKMLTQQLRELEADGVVHREVYRQVPPKVEYSLTARGESLRPVIQAITEWGLREGADASPVTNTDADNHSTIS